MGGLFLTPGVLYASAGFSAARVGVDVARDAFRKGLSEQRVACAWKGCSVNLFPPDVRHERLSRRQKACPQYRRIVGQLPLGRKCRAGAD